MSYILFCVNATHNNNSLRIESIIKDLVELSLIKCDPDNDNLNIHRLVQDEFNFQLSDSDRESVFNSAALSLYVKLSQNKSMAKGLRIACRSAVNTFSTFTA